jgi:hypothetical protein
MFKNAYPWKATSGIQRNLSTLSGTANYCQMRIDQDTAVPLHPISKRYMIKLEGDMVPRGFYLLLRSGGFATYRDPGNVYIVSEEQLALLRAEGILFKFQDQSVTVRDIRPVEI